MKRVLLMAAALFVACSHESTRPTSSGTLPPAASASAGQGQVLAQPGDLEPEQIRTLQRALSDRGFAVDATGLYDDKTQTALMDFQRARGLPASGALSQPTVEALGIDPRDVMPVRGTSAGSAAQPGASETPAARPGAGAGSAPTTPPDSAAGTTTPPDTTAPPMPPQR